MNLKPGYTTSWVDGREYLIAPAGTVFRVIEESERQAGTPWSGGGLPPAGTVCEYTDMHGIKWYRCEIIAYKGDQVWLQTTVAKRDHVKIVSAFRFRPIRTPEQLAADEREKAIEEIEDIISGFSYRHCAELIHDTGYRKP